MKGFGKSLAPIIDGQPLSFGGGTRGENKLGEFLFLEKGKSLSSIINENSVGASARMNK